MSGEPIRVPTEVLNKITFQLVQLTGELMDEHDPRVVVVCHWFTLGFIIAQCGGIVPDGQRLTDIDSFNAGYAHGLASMRHDA